jgi:hypothetical protein
VDIYMKGKGREALGRRHNVLEVLVEVVEERRRGEVKIEEPGIWTSLVVDNSLS